MQMLCMWQWKREMRSGFRICISWSLRRRILSIVLNGTHARLSAICKIVHIFYLYTFLDCSISFSRQCYTIFIQKLPMRISKNGATFLSSRQSLCLPLSLFWCVIFFEFRIYFFMAQFHCLCKKRAIIAIAHTYMCSAHERFRLA